MRRVGQLLISLTLLGAALVVARTSDAEPYSIDAAGSDIHWRVYRAGAFARFGHNHVISVGQFTGRASVDPSDLAKSSFVLDIPVMSLVVDDPALRGRHGEEFESVPSADDIAGTRQNMLGERLLRADEHPRLRVSGAGPSATADGQAFDVTVEIQGRSVKLQVPTRVTLSGDVLEASGEFSLSHADLGLTPFSAMGGALRVGDKIDFTYRIRARREAESEAPAEDDQAK